MITVLIPTFQRAKYLDFLLESISKQTIEGQIDCLISDANSKDTLDYENGIKIKS